MYILSIDKSWTMRYNEYKMSPTSISGGGNLLTGGELISPASCDAKLVPVGKGQEEVLPSAKLEQWPYNSEGQEEALSIDKAGTMAL